MPTIDRTVTVDKSPSVVWDYLSDFTKTEEWDPPTVSTTRTAGDGGVGTVYHNVTKFLGSETEVDYHVTDYVEGHRMELRASTSSMELHDTLTVEPEGTGTSVRYVAEFTPTGAAKLATPLMAPGLKVLGDKAAQQMQECLERL
ncbi:SRPBCC family protein [Nocardioides perillae]|uniref:Uncharacterized protein YndB with AHSA1/START domain n=1 Tax=Nocardioides perillae TaxID=1119534 RepID=A0A7Y9RRZ5_9ACTN|nr:uncharacterized protein YndB with AHSA1/START domain [Nocardioides perillae]